MMHGDHGADVLLGGGGMVATFVGRVAGFANIWIHLFVDFIGEGVERTGEAKRGESCWGGLVGGSLREMTRGGVGPSQDVTAPS